jgi:two-component system sensor histidine kinase QseC
LFGLVAGYLIYKNTMRETEELSDIQLTHFAQGLLVVAAQTDSDDLLRAEMEREEALRHSHQSDLAFQVWSTDKDSPHLLLYSVGADEGAGIRMPSEGFSDGEWRGERWRYYRQRDERHGFDVLVGPDSRVLEGLAQEMAWRSIVPLLFGMPILGLLLLLAIRFGLQPLRRLVNSLHSLTPERLSPLPVDDEPKEFVPVVNALNGLLQRITKAMENERRFTADASHELRTPLAALRAQIQAAQLSSTTNERNESLDKALRGAERMGHLVGQLLTLSRLDDTVASLSMGSVDMNALVQDCCAELGVAAVAKDIEISFVPQASVTLRGCGDMLHILLRNLLDNAIRYTPQGGRVEVVLRMANEQAELDILDSGAGVPDEQITQLGQRFHRLDFDTADGVGLGLSIVQRIVEIHRAQLVFSRAALGGLCVRVCFPQV